MLDNVQILTPAVANQVKTEFKVDTLTGTKTISTNDVSVLGNSEMLKKVEKSISITVPRLSDGTLIASTSVEYTDAVKMISLLKGTDDSLHQVVSIFDKTTSKVTIVEVTTATSDATPHFRK